MPRDISATVTPIGVKVCMTVELCPRTSFSLFDGDIFSGHQMLGQEMYLGGHWFLPFDREYLENGKSERYVPIRA